MRRGDCSRSSIESLGEPWLQTLSAHLGHASDPPDPVRQARRLSVVRHLADLFDRYALHRPEMVCGWASGELPSASSGDAAWQAALWCALRERIALPGPAERLESACMALQADATLVTLPARLSLFGLTRLPAADLLVLRALAAKRDVHLFVLHPSPGLWDAVASVIVDLPPVVAPRV